jgi:hypothetical protein
MKLNKTIACLAIALGLGLSAGAQAAASTLAMTYGSNPNLALDTTVSGVNWVSFGALALPSTEYFAGQVLGGAGDWFSDSFQFTVPAGGGFSGSATGYDISFSVGSGPTITPIMLSLYLYQGSQLVGNTLSGSLTTAIDTTKGTDFTLAVGGPLASAGGPGLYESTYTGQFSVEAVPEPSTISLALAGAVFVGLALRRRS